MVRLRICLMFKCVSCEQVWEWCWHVYVLFVWNAKEFIVFFFIFVGRVNCTVSTISSTRRRFFNLRHSLTHSLTYSQLMSLNHPNQAHINHSISYFIRIIYRGDGCYVKWRAFQFAFTRVLQRRWAITTEPKSERNNNNKNQWEALSAQHNTKEIQTITIRTSLTLTSPDDYIPSLNSLIISLFCGQLCWAACQFSISTNKTMP